MVSNHLKVTLRNYKKHPFYSGLNVISLAIGIATSLLIGLWIQNQLSFDQFIANKDNIHQLLINATFDGKINSQRSSPYPLYLELRQAESNIKNTALANWGEQSLLSVGEKKVIKQSYHVTKEFLQVMPYELAKGQPDRVLEDPTSLVLTESTAVALFGDENPLGKLVRVDNVQGVNELKVTGVVKDLPETTTFTFDCLMSMQRYSADFLKAKETDWGYYSFQILVELTPGASLEKVNTSIKDVLTKNGQTDMPRALFLFPLEKWHLFDNFENGKLQGGLIDYIYGFAIIAVFVLIMACINFMNLATARSERKAKEVGIRKSVGSSRQRLVAQFLLEAMFSALLAFLLALLLVYLVLPYFSTITQTHLTLTLFSAKFWVICGILILFTGFVSGCYPAFYLSSFQPAHTLKGKISVGKKGIALRKVLVILQFAFSAFLIISSLVISKQIEFAKVRDLGYDQQNLISIQYTVDLEKNLRPLRQELESTGVVTSMTISNNDITDIRARNFVDWQGKPKDQKVSFFTIATELDFTKTMGIKLLAGRDFTSPADSNSVLINKAAMEVMGVKDPIGSKISFWDRSATIVGVTEDVILTPFRKPNPIFVIFDPLWSNALSIRLEKTSDIQQSIKKIEKVFNKYNPTYPFTYAFVEDEFNKRYASINLTKSLANSLTWLTLLVAGLGLFGLSAFSAEQRAKEVSIRKVLGANIYQLCLLLSKEFAWLVLAGLAFACPGAWWFLSSFLEKYPYRIDFPFSVLAISALSLLAFSLLIVSIHAFKTAAANPTRSLKSE